MKKSIGTLLFLLILLLTACQTKPEIVDNGSPGTIEVTVYHDQDGNRVQDQGEAGLIDSVAIGQDVSCPIQQKPEEVETSADGVAVFTGLKPGVYCVMYMGDRLITTRMTIEVPLSSDQVAQVAFGLVADEGE